MNFREGFLLLYSVVALPCLLLCSSSPGIIGLGIDLDGVLQRSVAFNVLPRPMSSC